MIFNLNEKTDCVIGSDGQSSLCRTQHNTHENGAPCVRPRDARSQPRSTYRSDRRGDAGFVHGPDPWVMRGFDDRHPLLLLGGSVQWDGAAQGAVQGLCVLGICVCGVWGESVVTDDA